MTIKNDFQDGEKAAKYSETDKLIEAFKQGTPEAFDEIAERYKGTIAKNARRFDNGRGYFDDLYQEGMLALYRALCGYKPGGASFTTYAAQAVRNSMISWVRGKKGVRYGDVSIEELADADLPDVFADSPEEAILSKMFCHELKRRAIKLLSDYERCVFLLYLEDMTPTETAECLGKSKKSVENALNRIKTKLSDC